MSVGLTHTQQPVLQLIAVRNDVHVSIAVGRHLGNFQGLQVARQCCLSHDDVVLTQHFGQLTLAADAIRFDQIGDQL